MYTRLFPSSNPIFLLSRFLSGSEPGNLARLWLVRFPARLIWFSIQIPELLQHHWRKRSSKSDPHDAEVDKKIASKHPDQKQR